MPSGDQATPDERERERKRAVADTRRRSLEHPSWLDKSYRPKLRDPQGFWEWVHQSLVELWRGDVEGTTTPFSRLRSRWQRLHGLERVRFVLVRLAVLTVIALLIADIWWEPWPG